FAPATVANVGSGFDILGFALENPGDEMIVKLSPDSGIRITNRTPFKNIPLQPERNASGVSLAAMLQKLNSKQGFEIVITRKIMPGSGLGSSAAGSVASVYAANELLGKPFSAEELIPFAMEGEKVVSGVAHADNVGPAMLGGFVLIRSYKPLDIIRLDFPKELHCAVVHPQIEVRTEDARKILKDKITLRDAIIQWGNVAGLITGLFRGDFDLIGRSLEDVIIEPVRSVLIPSFDAVKKSALEAGALGCSISGSGPSIFALCKSRTDAERVALQMSKTFSDAGIENENFVSRIGKRGVRAAG
ncbi:MAG TPA: homoserine kinase, partial [Chitinophagales bacterium]|nr:homoserine kinase [Chitinophagales bacterium]